MGDLRNFLDGRDWFLAGSGVTDVATTITLTSMKYADGTTNVVTADIGSLGFMVLEPGTTRQESISFTTITQNGSGTATLTGVTRGLAPKAPYTTSAVYKEAHAGGSTARITNSAAFYNDFTNKDNDETINGVYTFVDPAVPRMNTAHTYIAGQEEYFATKRYADSLAIAGAPNASTTQKGIVEEATLAESIAGTDTGGTGARLFAVPSSIAANVQVQAHSYAADTGAADAYAIALAPAVTALAAGDRFVFAATNANTGASTLAVNGLIAKNVKKMVSGSATPANLAANDIVAGMLVDVEYTGGQFILQSPIGNMPTTAILNEMAAFFGSTDITGAEAETLTSSSASNADTLHTHSSLARGYALSWMVVGSSNGGGGTDAPCGFSDATTKLLCFSTGRNNAGTLSSPAVFGVATDFGVQPYLTFNVPQTQGAVDLLGSVAIGAAPDIWQTLSGPLIKKNGTNCTFAVGAASSGPCGHSPSSSFLLVLSTTTNINRYSGLAGTVLTQEASITLDTAVTATMGFFFDNTNSRYICLDTTANIIRRFNSTGVTVDTLAYTANDFRAVGVTVVNNRVHIAFQSSFGEDGAIDTAGGSVQLVPTSMTL